MASLSTLGAAVAVLLAPSPAPPEPIPLTDDWMLKSCWKLVPDGAAVSAPGFETKGWHPTRVPATVYSALVKNGVYPDIRIGLNSFRVPDASDDFNREHDLAQYSHLPDKRNPWKDPYWYRTEFTLPAAARGRHVWLNFDGIHYRADVWLNGRQVADAAHLAGSFSRYRLNATPHVDFENRNALAVRIHPMDHAGTPDTQLVPFGKNRNYRKDSMQDVGLVMFIGYDCMPTVPDRNMGLWQRVFLDFSGPVEIRDPFVTTRLPGPQTAPAELTVSVSLSNAGDSAQEGVLRGRVVETGGTFEKRVRLAPGETRQIEFLPGEHPGLTVEKPRLWWPRNYGPQNLYHLALAFETDGQLSDRRRISFGIRQIGREMHERDGAHGLRLLVNGERVFCRGGYIQPEIIFDWDARRMETEVRYLAEANINIIFFEDIPNPPEPFLDLCDRYGLMFGNCFYGCYWMLPGTPYPRDLELLARGTEDIIKRYRNHPSLVLYMAMNEGETREEVYTRWRRQIVEHDGTRLWIPSGSYPDDRKDVAPWIKPDTPVGMNDSRPKSYGWVEPAQFFRWVREEPNWMFMLESGCPSMPPVESLRRFLPGVEHAPAGPTYPVTAAWAHHDACHYFGPYDAALRKIFGPPEDLAEYLARGVLLSADAHRAMYEAANHRMWDITSGFSQWKLNACWPSVEWQLYDWYLRPLVSYYYVKKACEPLHVQLTPLDGAVTVVNHRLEPQEKLQVRARVYDLQSKLQWQKQSRVDMPANGYREVFAIPAARDASPVRFVQLELADAAGEVRSRNFYWLPAKDSNDLGVLARLPAVRLKTSSLLRREQSGWRAEVQVENPTERVALLVHLALMRGVGGEEILPVLWDDNYFCLAPGESRTLEARFESGDFEGRVPPVLQVDGWNVAGGR